MQFTSIFTLLAVAMTAAAVPSAQLARRDGIASPDICSSETQNVCCSGIAGCLVTVLGKNCDGEAYCCSNAANQAGLVDVDALNCVQVL